MYDKEEIGAVNIISTKFVSMLSQTPDITYLLPLDRIGNKDKEGNYVNAYLDVVFTQKEPKQADFDKLGALDIELKDAFLSTRKRGDKVSLVLVVQKWAKSGQKMAG